MNMGAISLGYIFLSMWNKLHVIALEEIKELRNGHEVKIILCNILKLTRYHPPQNRH